MLDVLSFIMKLACIDLDNTLAETTKTHVKAFRKAFKEFGLKPVPEKSILNLFGLKSEDMIKIIYPKVNRKFIKKVVKKHNEIVTKSTYKFAKRIKGADKALKYLRSKGYKLAIVSNSSFKEVERILDKLKIRNYDKIVSEDCVKRSKPAPDGINLVKKRFKAKEVIMVGDTIYDIIAGKKAKVTTVAVLTGHSSRNRLKKYKPDFIIKSIADLKKVV